MRVARLFAPLLVSLAFAATPTGAPAMILQGGHETTRLFDVAVAGKLAYLATSSGFLVVDVSDPMATVQLGRLDLPDLLPGPVAVDGDLAYVGFRPVRSGPPGEPPPGIVGLRVVDISDPANPSVLGTLAGGAGALALLDGCVYFGSQIIDVSDPTAPSQVGSLSQTGIADFEVAGERVYAVYGRGSFDSGLLILDASAPTAPIEIGRLTLPPELFAVSVSVSEGVAYVLKSSFESQTPSQVLSIDVSDPSTPALLGAVPLLGTAWDLAARGPLVFATSDLTLHAIDVSDPTAPVMLGELGFHEGVGRIVLSENTAYVGPGLYAGPYVTLRIIDVSEPSWPLRAGGLDESGGRVAVEGSLAYLPRGFDTSGWLQVLDVSDPAAPIEIGSLGGPTDDVVLDGDHAFVTGGSRLRILDVSEPTAPVERGALDAPGVIRGTAVTGGLAYVAYGQAPGGGLQIVDVSDPALPIELARLPTSTAPFAVGLLGNFAYLGADGYVGYNYFDPSRLIVINVSRPASPFQVLELPIPFEPTRGGRLLVHDILVKDDLAYVVVQAFGVIRNAALLVLDVSNPAAPAQVALEEGYQYFGNDLALDGDRLYLAHPELGPRSLDVSNPARPRALGAFPMPEYDSRGNFLRRYGAEGLALGMGLVYAVNPRAGLTIVDFGPEYASPRRVGLDVKSGTLLDRFEFVRPGVIPAAILGATDFAVAEIDVNSLAFGPDRATPIHSTGGHIADVNGDGHPDLLSHYRTQETGIAYGDTEGCVRGVTRNRARFEGCDRIATWPPTGRR